MYASLCNISVLNGNVDAALLSLLSFNAAVCCLMCLSHLSYCIRHILSIQVAPNDSLSLRLALLYPSIMSLLLSNCSSSITYHSASIFHNPSDEKPLTSISSRSSRTYRAVQKSHSTNGSEVTHIPTRSTSFHSI